MFINNRINFANKVELSIYNIQFQLNVFVFRFL